MYETLIQRVQVIDGTGSDGYSADIGIKDGKIAAIGSLSTGAERTIDGTGLVATPGFVDMHSHSDLALLQSVAPDAKVRQGITTELLAQDGLGVAPIDDENVKLLSELTADTDRNILIDQY